nr:putative polyprotein [Tanacetum cinerariifolium]
MVRRLHQHDQTNDLGATPYMLASTSFFWNEQASNVFQKEREQYIKIQDLKAQLQDKNISISELKKLIEKGKGKSVKTKFDKPSVVRQPNAQRFPKPSVLGVTHKTNVSRPHHRSNELKDKVVPNNSQVKLKKAHVEEHPRIPSISNKIKSVTACNDSLNSRNLNVNAVCATCEKCLVDSDHFACVTQMLNDVNARSKKPNVVPISTRKPKSHANKFVAIPHKKKVVSKSTTQKPKSYYRMFYEKTGKANVVADALSRKSGMIAGIKHGYWASLRIEPDLISRIKEAQKEDSEIWTIVENLNKQVEFRLDDDNVLWQDTRLVVPNDATLREALLTEAHS